MGVELEVKAERPWSYIEPGGSDVGYEETWNLDSVMEEKLGKYHKVSANVRTRVN